MEDSLQVFDYIPEDVAPYSMTSEEIFWPSGEWLTTQHLEKGILVSPDEIVPFSEITLAKQHVTDGILVDRMKWDDMELVSSVSVPNIGTLLVFSREKDGTVESLAMSYNALAAAFNTNMLLRETLSTVIAHHTSNELIDFFEGNLDWIFTPPPPQVQNVTLTTITQTPPSEPNKQNSPIILMSGKPYVA